MTKTQVNFQIDGKQISFNIFHELINDSVIIELALNQWIIRTKKYTAKSFVHYLKSKVDGQVMTEKQYNKLVSNLKDEAIR